MKWRIEERFYSVVSGWSEWWYDYDRGYEFTNRNEALKVFKQCKREETDTWEHRIVEVLN